MNERDDSRVLIVEDDASERNLLQRALARNKITADWAADGVEADILLAKKRYDVVLSDLRMPRKHGHKLIVEILSRPLPPAVIATTGVVEYKILADLFERGVEDVLIKPFNLNMLALRVKALLARATARAHPEQALGAASEIGPTAASLKQQLSELQCSFSDTVERLERQRDGLEQAYLASVRLMTGLMDQLGKTDAGHSGRVERLAVSLAKELDVDGQGVYALRMASLLHELGMFGLPDAVRAKAPWHLSDEELSVVQQYPLIGTTLLSEIRGTEAVIDIIETHAENFDGTGFPSGLRGTSIPLLGRIARLADGIDTFSMHYTGPDKIEAIIVHLNEHCGKLYDPELVPLALNRVPFAYRDNRRDVRRVDIGHAAEGLALAGNVYNDDGRLVARQGAVLTPALLVNLGMWIETRTIDVFALDDEY